MDTQVLTHLLLYLDVLTSILSACERLLRTPIPLGYNIAISRIVWIFIFLLPSQLWRELRWWSIAVTMVAGYALFSLAEVGLEIENPWGEGENDLDLDRYCLLLELDLGEVVGFQAGASASASASASVHKLGGMGNGITSPLKHGIHTHMSTGNLSILSATSAKSGNVSESNEAVTGKVYGTFDEPQSREAEALLG